jgi:hypothetical protein
MTIKNLRYISIFVLAVFFMLGCKPPAEVSFSVRNGSTHKIFIEYTPFSTNDTQVVQLGPDTLVTLLDVENTTGASNWFYDYQMHIINIYNILGDTTVIDPNVSQYWFLYVGGPTYQYKLDVKDTDF